MARLKPSAPGAPARAPSPVYSEAETPSGFKPEAGFVNLYARDFITLAARAEAGQDVEDALTRRIGEARSHAQLMDSRKGPGHLEAVADHLKSESRRADVRFLRDADDPAAALLRREDFLMKCAERLGAEA